MGGDGYLRYARTDLEVCGEMVRTGDLVLLDTGAANHDPTVFPDPDRLDFTRSEPGHLSFGHGGRYCIGAPLARIELHAVFSQLLARFPNMTLAVEPEELTIGRQILPTLAELPVTW
jgi:pentalenolactone synthase